jgi:hypothetical protein
MRSPFLFVIAAATLLAAAAPALAHDGAVHCPMNRAAVRHIARHARHGCPCQPQAALEGRRHLAFEGHGWAPAPARGGEEAYGRQDFSWAPTGPGDEHPGPSTWRPGPGGAGLYGAPPAGSPAAGFADHRLDQRGFDQRDGGERAFSDRFDAEQRGAGEREYAFGYSHEEEHSWSSHSGMGGGSMEHGARNCADQTSATDQFGFLTWPGKTHFWRGPPAGDPAMGPPPGADAPQGPIIVHP